MAYKPPNEVFRDYSTDGVPGSGAHQPVKSEIRGMLNAYDGLLGENLPARVADLEGQAGLSSPGPTLAITFDAYHTSETIARPLMNARGIPGTMFLQPDYINTVNSQGFSRSELTAMMDSGWEVGVYPLTGDGKNMIQLRAISHNAAYDRMVDCVEKCAAIDIPVFSMVAPSRLWSTNLQGLSRQLFRNIRVADLTESFYDYSAPDDRNYVRKGGSVSFGNTWTLETLEAKLDALIATGGAWFPNVHELGNVADASTMTTSMFTGFLDMVVTRRNAGLLRVTTFDRALTR